MKRTPVAVALIVLSVAPLAAGQDGSRQAVDLVFDEQRPGRATGSRLAIDYVNPNDPQAKPPAVQKVVIAYAPGTVIDTSVPARCEASNAELTTRGPDACPAASKVGVGEVDLDTGFPGPGRILSYNVTMLNNTRELILVLESKSDSRSRIVARSVVDGATITTEVSGVPGGPPDGFTAIKRVRLGLDELSAGGGRYVTTPDSCPADGLWTNTVTFTYRDGASQVVHDSSPCIAGATAPRDDQPPRITVMGVRRKPCARGAVRARVRITESGSGLARAQLWVDGRRVLTTTRERFSRRIQARSNRRRRLKVVAVDNAGNRAVKRVRVRSCPR
jgi:hypothetical protein